MPSNAVDVALEEVTKAVGYLAGLDQHEMPIGHLADYGSFDPFDPIGPFDPNRAYKLALIES